MGVEIEVARFIATACFIAVVGFYLARHKDALKLINPWRAWRITKKMKRREWVRLILCSTILIAVLLAVVPFSAWFIESVTQQPLVNVEDHPVTIVSSISVPLTFCLMMILPIFEEWIFRGILLRGLRKRIPLLNAIIVSSICFGIFHLFNSGTYFWAFIPPTIAGFIFSIAYLKGGLGGAVLTHSMYNGIVLTIMFI